MPRRRLHIDHAVLDGGSVCGRQHRQHDDRFVLVVFPLTEAFLPLSDALTEVPSYQDSIKRMSKAAPELRSREVKQTDEKLDVSDVTLTFDNVTFSYDQHSHVLDRFSFTLRQGEKWRCSAGAAPVSRPLSL